MNVTSPKTKREFERYYHLRWRILRAPWNQPTGSERDEFEDDAYHVMVCITGKIPVGIGRLHFNTADEAQIRYMAVEESQRRHGIGTAILDELESEAVRRNARSIMLNARKSVIPFYCLGVCRKYFFSSRKSRHEH